MKFLIGITTFLLLLIIGAFAFYIFRAVPAFLDARDGEVIAYGNCAYDDKSELKTECVSGTFKLYEIAVEPSYTSTEFGCVMPKRFIVCDE